METGILGIGILGIGIIITVLDLALRILGITALYLFIKYLLNVLKKQ